MSKPGIIVLPGDDDTEFTWMSDGWNTIKHPNPELMVKANQCISMGEDVPDTIKRLEAEGFKVRRA